MYVFDSISMLKISISKTSTEISKTLIHAVPCSTFLGTIFISCNVNAKTGEKNVFHMPTNLQRNFSEIVLMFRGKNHKTGCCDLDIVIQLKSIIIT